MRSLILVVVGLLVSALPARLRRIEASLFRLAEVGRLPHLAFALVIGLIAFLGSGLVEWISGVSFPYVHDEFSYLLMADTFAEGRLANPTHPLWPHFESFHVLMTPTYVSKYPPGQGVVLALGQVIFGQPIVGVWLSAAICAVCVHWMLLKWLPRRWAALGAWIFLLKIGIVSYWSHSYWGGYVAAIGGALVAGAARQLADRPAAAPAALFSLGAVILANSRPFEGLALCVVSVGFVLLRWVRSTRPDPWMVVRRTAVAALLPLAGGALAMAIYNSEVTGELWTTPYALHQEIYHSAPIFLFQEPGPVPDYSLEPMRELHLAELDYFRAQQSLGGAMRGIRFKWGNIKSTFMPRGFGVLWFVMPFLFFARSTRTPAVLATLLVVASLLPNRFFPHYVAPHTGLFILVLIAAMRRLGTLKLARRRVGLVLVSVMLVFCLLTVVEEGWSLVRRQEPERIDRRAVARRLYEDGDQHLVIVSYGPTHNPAREWVYNRADIDNAKVVWGRDLGPERNRELLEYFSARRSWRLFYDSGRGEVSLTPLVEGS